MPVRRRGPARSPLELRAFQRAGQRGRRSLRRRRPGAIADLGAHHPASARSSTADTVPSGQPRKIGRRRRRHPEAAASWRRRSSQELARSWCRRQISSPGRRGLRMRDAAAKVRGARPTRRPPTRTAETAPGRARRRWRPDRRQGRHRHASRIPAGGGGANREPRRWPVSALRSCWTGRCVNFHRKVGSFTPTEAHQPLSLPAQRRESAAVAPTSSQKQCLRHTLRPRSQSAVRDLVRKSVPGRRSSGTVPPMWSVAPTKRMTSASRPEDRRPRAGATSRAALVIARLGLDTFHRLSVTRGHRDTPVRSPSCPPPPPSMGSVGSAVCAPMNLNCRNDLPWPPGLSFAVKSPAVLRVVVLVVVAGLLLGPVAVGGSASGPRGSCCHRSS